jgi:hypothetical protein
MTAFWFAAILILQSQIPAQVQPGTVTGRLLSANGTPAAGIRIAAVPVDSEAQAGAAVLFGISQTETDGRYRIENIPPGRYYIFAGLLEFPSYYPSATTLERATAVTVDAGSTLSGMDFTMARPVGLTVSGRLEIPSTMRVTTATVTLSSQALRGTSTSSTQLTVGSDGAFEFQKVPPGEYRLTSTLLGSMPVSLRVDEADRTNLVIPVIDCNAGVSVSGQLVGAPASAVRTITLLGSRAGCAPATTLNANGTFTFNGVPEGEYRIQLTPAPLGWAAVGVTVGKTDLSEVTVRLPASFVVKGRATVEDGSHVPRTSRGTPIAIKASGNGGDVVASIMDDGTFELPLPEGSYRISVAGVPSGYILKSMTQGSRDLSMSSLHVAEEISADIRLLLASIRRPERGVRLTGRLSFAAAGALPKSEGVVLVSSSAGRNAPVRESTLTPDGSFEFSGVPPGIYNLETFPDNPSAIQGIVVAQSDVTGIEFAVPVLVQVRGGIEWPDAAVPTNLSVQFTRKEGDRMRAWGALTQSGAFHFYLPEGDYRFSVSDIPSTVAVSSVTAGDVNVLENGLQVRSDLEPPNVRVLLRHK